MQSIFDKNLEDKYSSRSTRTEKLEGYYTAAWERYFKEGGNIDMSFDDLMFVIYRHTFHKIPNKITTYRYPIYLKERLTDGSNFGDKCVDGSDKELDKWDNIIPENSILNFINYYEKNNIAYIRYRYENYTAIINEYEEIIIDTGIITVFEPVLDKFPEYMMDLFVFSNERSTRYYYMAHSKDGYDTIELNIKEPELDINMNYNDDLPYDEIVDSINSDTSGLIILRGEPGTGKSTLIRHLITTLDTDFVYLDHSCFDSMTDSSFIQTLADYEHSVLILEDCEDMVKDRLSNSGSNKLAALLNLSSGLLGDSFQFHIIISFNAPIKNVDKALLRKGRLMVDYEFKKLSAKKTAALGSKLEKNIKPGESLTLADIYNYGQTVEYGKKENNSIGFK